MSTKYTKEYIDELRSNLYHDLKDKHIWLITRFKALQAENINLIGRVEFRDRQIEAKESEILLLKTQLEKLRRECDQKLGQKEMEYKNNIKLIRKINMR